MVVAQQIAEKEWDTCRALGLWQYPRLPCLGNMHVSFGATNKPRFKKRLFGLTCSFVALANRSMGMTERNSLSFVG